MMIGALTPLYFLEPVKLVVLIDPETRRAKYLRSNLPAGTKFYPSQDPSVPTYYYVGKANSKIRVLTGSYTSPNGKVVSATVDMTKHLTSPLLNAISKARDVKSLIAALDTNPARYAAAISIVKDVMYGKILNAKGEPIRAFYRFSIGSLSIYPDELEKISRNRLAIAILQTVNNQYLEIKRNDPNIRD